MSASAAPALDAIAFQLAAALEHYETRVSSVVAAWPDLEGYADASAQMDKIRLYSESLPDLRVQWVDLLITHAELVHHLWRSQDGVPGAHAARVAPALEQHLDAVAALSNSCHRVMARPRDKARSS